MARRGRWLQDIAARGSATAADVSARCAQWHAAVSEVLVEQAEFLGTPPQALVKAISMAHTTLAATLARVEEAFGEQALGARPSQPSHERPAARARQASSLFVFPPPPDGGLPAPAPCTSEPPLSEREGGRPVGLPEDRAGRC